MNERRCDLVSAVAAVRHLVGMVRAAGVQVAEMCRSFNFRDKFRHVPAGNYGSQLVAH